ncbi:hypothetical protein [Chachezhania sediminis]|uniref:hypothetical protein n=1 Tax=Chachezhania sediminis TaxID=2599291 RepID=UPI00131CA4D4|nr:hypothetical protein [Chachezhania sediminis]
MTDAGPEPQAAAPAGARFAPDRSTYIRAQAWLAALAMAGGMAVLWMMDSPYIWTGAIGGLAAIALRGWYLASDELSAEWHLQGDTLTGPGDTRLHLDRIETVRSAGHMVQVITTDGNKYLIRYQADPKAVTDRLTQRHRTMRGVE